MLAVLLFGLNHCCSCKSNFFNAKGDQKNPNQTSSNSYQDTNVSQDVERVGMTMDVKHDPNVKHDVTLWILDQLIQGI